MTVPRTGRPNRILVGLVTLLAGAAAACVEPLTSPSDFAPFSQTDLRVGTGAEIVQGSVVSVNYTGWLYNATAPEQKGAVFDSSGGREPFTFTVGAGQVIKGWEQGVVGMKVGGLRELVIPPSLGYGTARNGLIPPSSTLIFEIEVIELVESTAP